MKKCILFILIAITIPAVAQFHKGAIELSFSGDGGINKNKVEAEEAQYSEYNHESSESFKYFTLFVRGGYFLNNQLSLEPEVFWTTEDENYPTYFFAANMAYHFPGFSKRTVPFLLVGAGIGNAMPLANSLLISYQNKFNVHLFNVGAGLKFPLNEKVALRVEYRYQQYQMDSTIGLYQNDSLEEIPAKYTYFENNLLVGFSAFIK